ncbi:uncharacterized protein LOC113558938 isoform X2 [Rhopalosiphum maidis]|uniref:uncharacterized protein LOC113558938 isoform X2 n=1 Tax=Rhopalosiphum maidis TaxID=43146 RepID=UPI000EFDFC29|nr:uncharacterized protein LOC113558938 isoform X2 [Rhopalosiphum maidis]
MLIKIRGIGQTQLTEFTTFLEVPSLSCSGFNKVQVEIGNIIYKSSWDEMKHASEEKKRIGIECGDVDSDGIPMCTVSRNVTIRRNTMPCPE